MMLYLVKTVVCQLIFLAIYYFALEREKMHGFNRFYLLFSLSFALIIPLVPTVTIPEALSLPTIENMNAIVTQPKADPPMTAHLANTSNILRLLPLILYGLIALALLIRFIGSIVLMRSEIIRNKRVNYGSAQLVLLDKKVPPHTFFRYIFVNKNDFDLNRIEEELLTHELAHVRQRHSLDVLFIEVLQIIFWFNPLIFFYKRAIKLNHEFLADHRVIRSHHHISTYQHMLLDKLYEYNGHYLANSSNYLLTKKRLIMMTKTKYPLRIVAKQALVFPLFIAIAIVFTNRTLAQVPKTDNTQDESHDVKNISQTDSLTKIKDHFYQNSTARFGIKDKDGQRVYKKYDELTDEEKKHVVVPPLPKIKQPSQDQLTSWLDSNNYGVWVDGKRIENKALKNYSPADFGYYFVSRLMKNAKNYGKHDFQVDLMTVPSFNAYNEDLKKRLGIE